MTDSTFAWIFFLVGGTDAYLNDCPTNCFAQTEAPARIHVQYGDTYFQEEIIGDEIFVSYDLPKRIGSIQPTVGVSMTNENDLWMGAGGKWTTDRVDGGPFFIEVALMPGIYLKDDGPNLGFPVQWRGSLGAGLMVAETASLSVFYDHRSNANTSETNPGIETVGVRVSYQFD